MATSYSDNSQDTKSSIRDNFRFNSTRAYDIIQRQVDIGPRYPGSKGIEEVRRLIATELQPVHKWMISYQNFSKNWRNNEETKLVNIICEPTEKDNNEPSILLLAHYDTRLWADQDPNPLKKKQPVLGANDAASGVAVVLELGRVLLEDYNISNIQLILFDGEDQGSIYDWNYLEGSRYFIQSQIFLNQKVYFGILFDMVGATNATFKREKYSDEYSGDLVDLIWNEAALLDFNDYFVNLSFGPIIDDHLPFLEKGITAVDIIDDFINRFHPWHTSFDNMSYIDENTLKAVGFTIESVLTKLSNSTILTSNFSSFNFQTKFLIFDLFDIFLIVPLIVAIRRRKGNYHEI
jgi:Zn-dependent M28 family amino/carboxypeptidase